MNLLVTAGNTQAPIDTVRCLTNIFTGRTGANIALEAARRGINASILTSHPETVSSDIIDTRPYKTFDDLHDQLRDLLCRGQFDAIIHAAAVSDYLVEGIYDQHSTEANRVSAEGKIKSNHPQLWLRLVPAPKLIDLFRSQWSFKGILVKFKLEVGRTDEELESIAEAARVQSRANLMVANTLEGMREWAMLGPRDGQYIRIERDHLAARLIDSIEALHKGN